MVNEHRIFIQKICVPAPPCTTCVPLVKCVFSSVKWTNNALSPKAIVWNR